MLFEQNSSSYKNSKLTQDSSCDEVHDFKLKEIRKRRSRNDLNNRDFKCEFCNKGYLSKCALNSHVYKRHSNINNMLNIPKTPKGRPKKVDDETELKKKFIFSQFFSSFPIRNIINNSFFYILYFLL